MSTYLSKNSLHTESHNSEAVTINAENFTVQFTSCRKPRIQDDSNRKFLKHFFIRKTGFLKIISTIWCFLCKNTQETGKTILNEKDILINGGLFLENMIQLCF
ncbi:hypothetical protein RF11_10151 [Thelohanellus kitauei]|uniref:Uncharacterized protein n=1 Tax=Thelohanellus kitauei TaxID=669202 RepID=A0A0C2MNV4_THEKT|nr:hypothetical protein RF11_10151 [Thelohanellus kitauei]